MIVALTGATGFVGGHVVDALLAAGHNIRALTRKPQADRAGVTWIAGDLQNLSNLCESAEAVIHVAGVVNGSAEEFDRGNRLGTLALLDAAKGKRFVHVSSLAAREPQLANYGASKRAAEDAVVAWDGDWRIIRPPAIYGPYDTDNLELFRFARRGLLPLPPRGRLSVIHAADLARLIVAMAEGGASHVLYEADDGIPGGWSHKDFARAIGAAVGKKPLTFAMPKGVLKFGAMLDGAVRGDRAKLTQDRVNYFVHPDWTVDAGKRPPSTLWAPQIATAPGLAATAAWYREKGWL